MKNIRSDSFYIRIRGTHALFTIPYTKGGGEKNSYPIPTQQALTGIADAIYWKPVLRNVVDQVKVMNPIKQQVRGTRALLKNGKLDLNYVNYLVDVEYLIKYHFVWNMDREDLAADRNMGKHTAIAKRSIQKGGRRDVFLGTRECVGFVEQISKEEYENATSFYHGQHLPFGLMFKSFKYPKESGEQLISTYTNIQMNDGVISFEDHSADEIQNYLSNYTFKYPAKQKSVDEELKNYDKFDSD